jgi:hypothetical protein
MAAKTRRVAIGIKVSTFAKRRYHIMMMMMMMIIIIIIIIISSTLHCKASNPQCTQSVKGRGYLEIATRDANCQIFPSNFQREFYCLFIK